MKAKVANRIAIRQTQRADKEQSIADRNAAEQRITEPWFTMTLCLRSCA